MDVSRYAQAHKLPLALPGIYSRDPSPMSRDQMYNKPDQYAPKFSSIASSMPMSIPNRQSSPPPPPPLIPPRYPDVNPVNGFTGPDIAWHWSNSRQDRGTWGVPAGSVKVEPSLHGSFHRTGRNLMDERPPTSCSGSSASTGERHSRKDDGATNFSVTDLGPIRIQLGDCGTKPNFQSSVHARFRSNNAQAYDKSLLQKLDFRKPSDSPSSPSRGFPRSPFESSLHSASPTSIISQEFQQGQKAVSLPLRSIKMSTSDSSALKWPEGRQVEANPPDERFTERNKHRALGDADGGDASRHGQREQITHTVENRPYSRQSKFEKNQYVDVDHDFHMEEASGLRRLRIDDSISRFERSSPTSAAGQKRRASSPPRDDGHPLYPTVSAPDMHRRHESSCRASPAHRLHSNHGSISSTASMHHGSYGSVPSLTTSSVTTVASFDRLSPGGFSAGGLSPGPTSPKIVESVDMAYMTSSNPTRSPREIYGSPGQSTAIESQSVATSRHSDFEPPLKMKPAKVHGSFICECCPKKPKKFDAAQELAAHELEKQYECLYCKNRFKNKNEAERHQNSLHLRRHSWSCAALSGTYPAVFHPSPNQPAEADTCGYCGAEFVRTGPPGANGRLITDRDWKSRIQHLVDVHKVGECNQGKKFFRADHFRQHLKHSHAGTSGKWTNMLENACMKDEPLPQPIRGPGSNTASGQPRPARISEEEEFV